MYWPSSEINGATGETDLGQIKYVRFKGVFKSAKGGDYTDTRIPLERYSTPDV